LHRVDLLHPLRLPRESIKEWFATRSQPIWLKAPGREVLAIPPFYTLASFHAMPRPTAVFSAATYTVNGKQLPVYYHDQLEVLGKRPLQQSVLNVQEALGETDRSILARPRGELVQYLIETQAAALGKVPADYDVPDPTTRYNRVATPNRRPGEVIECWSPTESPRRFEEPSVSVSGQRKRCIHTADHFTSSGTVGKEQHARRISQQHEDNFKLGVGHGKRPIHLADHFDTQGTCRDKTAPIQNCLQEDEAEVRGGFQTMYERGLGHQKRGRHYESHFQNLGTVEPDWLRTGRKPLFD